LESRKLKFYEIGVHLALSKEMPPLFASLFQGQGLPLTLRQGLRMSDHTPDSERREAGTSPPYEERFLKK
jgi:hypothetical protein